MTEVTNKQLLPIYDKPMIYYSLSILMLAGITEILLISTPNDLSKFKNLFDDGTSYGMRISYAEQPSPSGIAQAFIIGEKFIGNDDVCLILGDNILYGHGLTEILKNTVKNLKEEQRATVFGYYVKDPERFGVVEFNNQSDVLSVEEKPLIPKSNFAIIGLYFYPNSVIDIAKKIKPSHRGELEITDINQEYLKQKKLKVELLGRGYAWLDTGTQESLLEASMFIQTVEKRQGLKVACIEEVAYEMGYISKKQFLSLAEPIKNNRYGQYIIQRASEGRLWS